MIKITKQQSWFVSSIIVLVGGMLCIPMFQTLTRWLGGFVFPFSPWEGWFGWACYAVVWFYALIAWAICWLYQYIMWFTPVAVILLAIMTIKKREQLRVEGYKKVFVFQTRKLAKTYRPYQGFGQNELNAFLNVTHLALTSRINKKNLQEWFLLGFRQGSRDSKQILENVRFDIIYAPKEGELAHLPDLYTNGTPCLVH